MSAKESTRLDASQPSQNIKIKLSSFSSTVVDKAAADLVVALKRVNATVLGAIPLPNATTFFTVNRSPHVDGSSREKMKLVKHHRMIILLDAYASQIEEISSINIASGVGIEIQIMNAKKD
jgi:small subunit ribosomal protein S10